MSVSSQIHALLQPPDVELSNQRALELLNRDFTYNQTLSSLDAALSKAQADSEALQQSLASSQAEISSSIAKARAKAETLMYTAQELSLFRHSLTDELSSLTEDLVSSISDGSNPPTLLEDIETMHRSLKEQESIKTYIQVLHKGLVLSEAAVSQVRTTQPIDISQYQALRAYTAAVESTCSQVGEVVSQPGTVLRIVSFLKDIQVKTWNDMKAALTGDLVAAADVLQWPKPIDWSTIAEPEQAAFIRSFRRLLELQTIADRVHASDEKVDAVGGLYAIQALVQSVSLRFKYHFEGTRQTNKLDKPEWYFTHILNVAHEHRTFMEQVVQTLLASSVYKHINAWREFTFYLLPLLSRRIKRTMPLLLPHPPLLAHTIYQALAFDSSLREQGFGLAGTKANRSAETAQEWEGISAVILDKKEWFEQWIEGEKAFALEQYNDIISSPDAWTVANDEDPEASSTTDRDLHPTVSARRLKALVEQVTDRYSPLPQFAQRTRFLILVQLPLLESYHARVSASLDAFEALSSTLVRAVPGALGVSDRGRNAQLTSGPEGAARLCKGLVSAKWISTAMETWGEDLFFVELWTEINHKASLRVRAETNPLLPDPKGPASDIPEGTIFEELILQYNKLVERADDLLVRLVSGEVESYLKAYFMSQLSDEPPAELNSDMAVPLPLLTALAAFAGHLDALRQSLPPTIARSIYRRCAAQLATHIFQRALFYRRPRSVTPAVGRRLEDECVLWPETARQALRGTRVDAPWARLVQAARVLGAEGPRWERIQEVSFGTAGDKEWADTMEETLGGTELTRDEVCTLVRTREDCSR